MDDTKMPQIYQLIPKVSAAIGAVGRDSRNQGQGYNYRSIHATVDAAHPAFAAHGVFPTSTILESRREERQTQKGGTLIYTILRVRFTFFAPDGSSVTSEAEGEGMDPGDKSTNKAMSAALKYVLSQMLLIPFSLEDSEEHNPEPAPRHLTPDRQPAVQAQSPPAPTTQFGPQYLAMSAQTAGSLMGKFNAALSLEEQKQIVVGITKEVTALLTPEDLQRVRHSHSACTLRLQQLAAKPVTSA